MSGFDDTPDQGTLDALVADVALTAYPTVISFVIPAIVVDILFPEFLNSVNKFGS